MLTTVREVMKQGSIIFLSSVRCSNIPFVLAVCRAHQELIGVLRGLMRENAR